MVWYGGGGGAWQDEYRSRALMLVFCYHIYASLHKLKSKKILICIFFPAAVAFFSAHLNSLEIAWNESND